VITTTANDAAAPHFGFLFGNIPHEAVSKVDLFTPKAFPSLAQGNTLGLGGAPEHTLKALNNDPMQTHSRTNYQTLSG
jgi:hypothetical protein